MKGLLSCACALLTALVVAQAPLRVATRIVPPFVMQRDGRLVGFSIDLWNDICSRAGLRSRFVVERDVSSLLKAIDTGKADLGIAAISVTSERERRFEFSQPMFDSGLQILTLKGKRQGNELMDRLNEILSSGILKWIASIFILGIVPAHIVWLCERCNPRGLLKNPRYFPGIFEAYWWSLSTLATQAEEMPKTALGRVVGVLWMFSAVIFIAFFTAQVTTSMTVQQLTGAIRGSDDLPGKTVATTIGSTSEEYLRSHGAKVASFPRIESAYQALSSGKADAVVFDSPVLLYFASHEGKGRYQVVGDVFRKENYGIVFNPNSRYRRAVNLALLSMKEDGTYEDLYTRWFGE